MSNPYAIAVGHSRTSLELSRVPSINTPDLSFSRILIQFLFSLSSVAKEHECVTSFLFATFALSLS
jgi:hypothetical protein